MSQGLAGSDDVLELTAALVGIDSQNIGAGESEVVDYVATWGRERGFDSTVYALEPGRPNIVLTCDAGGRHLGFSGHLDTKPVGEALGEWNTDPHKLTLIGDRAYGLGASDMKAGVAAMMLALDAFAQDPVGSLSLILTADEEQGSRLGARYLAEAGVLPELDGLVIGEPSGISTPFEAIHLVSRGVCCFTIEIRTRQGHSSLSPLLGRNAILVAADLLRAFETFVPPAGEPGAVDARATVNSGMFVEGGLAYGMWPGRCVIGIEIRLTPGMRQHELLAAATAYAESVVAGAATLTVKAVDGALGWIPAVELSPDSVLAICAQRACESVLDRTVPFGAYPGGTDATWFVLADATPTIASLGPGWLSVAHGANESVGVEQLGQARDIYRALARAFLSA